jgi:hypothetical protein
MSLKLLSSKTVIYQIILFLFFCISVNNFIDLEFINYLAYVFFHLTFIYLIFYYFKFILFFIFFIYGVLFDIFLINYISPHLITFLSFILLFYYTKKYLLKLSSNKISYIIFFSTLMMFIEESLIANILFNYPLKFDDLSWLFITTIIIFLPSLLIFSRIDKL